MPLLKGKSKKTFGHNVEAEMHAGKPQAQSLAIAYDMKRRSPKKMASGGYNSADPNLQDPETAGNETSAADKRAEAMDEAKRLHEAVRRGWNSPEAPPSWNHKIYGEPVLGEAEGGEIPERREQRQYSPEQMEGLQTEINKMRQQRGTPKPAEENQERRSVESNIHPKFDRRKQMPKAAAEGGVMDDETTTYVPASNKKYEHTEEESRKRKGFVDKTKEAMESRHKHSVGEFKLNDKLDKTAAAEGGKMMKPKMQAKRGPRMVSSSVIKPHEVDGYGRKMAEGGHLNDEDENGQEQLGKNANKKELYDSDWTGRPTVAQAQKESRTSLSRPPIQGENDFDGNELISADKPDGYGKQPKKSYDEDGPNRQGSKVPDMADEHSTHRKPYAKGGQIEPGDIKSKNMFLRTKMEPEDSGIQSHERSEESDLERGASPSEDEGASDAKSRNEIDPDRQGHSVRDMEREHSNGRMPYADGGMTESQEPDQNEEREERHDSLAAAIMAKRDRMHAMIDSGAMDMDHAVHGYADGGLLDKIGSALDSAVGNDKSTQDKNYQSNNPYKAAGGSVESGSRDMNYAEGGEAMLKENNQMEQPNRYYHQNEDYALDFVAGDKMPGQPEDSNEKGDDREDDSENKHDHIEIMRRKMKSRKQF
jgi:hypothetical protein